MAVEQRAGQSGVGSRSRSSARIPSRSTARPGTCRPSRRRRPGRRAPARSRRSAASAPRRTPIQRTSSNSWSWRSRSPPSAPSGSSGRSCGSASGPGRTSTRWSRRRGRCAPRARSPRAPRGGPSPRSSRAGSGVPLGSVQVTPSRSRRRLPTTSCGCPVHEPDDDATGRGGDGLLQAGHAGATEDRRGPRRGSSSSTASRTRAPADRCAPGEPARWSARATGRAARSAGRRPGGGARCAGRAPPTNADHGRRPSRRSRARADGWTNARRPGRVAGGDAVLHVRIVPRQGSLQVRSGGVRPLPVTGRPAPFRDGRRRARAARGRRRAHRAPAPRAPRGGRRSSRRRRGRRAGQRGADARAPGRSRPSARAAAGRSRSAPASSSPTAAATSRIVSRRRDDAAGREHRGRVVGGLRARRQPDRHAADRLGHLGEVGRELVVALDRDRRARGAPRAPGRGPRTRPADGTRRLGPGGQRRPSTSAPEQAARVDDRLAGVQAQAPRAARRRRRGRRG